MIETSARQAAAVRQQIQELTVEDKLLSMTEIKIKDEVKLHYCTLYAVSFYQYFSHKMTLFFQYTFVLTAFVFHNCFANV